MMMTSKNKNDMKRTEDEFETGQPAILAPPHLNLFRESTSNLLWMMTVPLKEGKRVTLDGRCTFSYVYCLVVVVGPYLEGV
jgi:hypothetical protein